MTRSGGNPGDEPRPSELWIEGGAGGGPPGGPGSGRGVGGPGRARWVALALGFVVLVAVIAVQHFAGGAPSGTTASSSAPATSPTASTAPTSTAPTSVASTHSGSTASGAPASPASTAPSGSGWASVAPGPGHGGVSAADLTTGSQPLTTTVRAPRLTGAAGWELVGYGPSGVVRYRPASGTLTVTPVPPLASTGPLSFVATSRRAIIRPLDSVPGYLVRRGHRTGPLPGLLATATQVLPGPDPSHVWISGASRSGRGQQTGNGTLVLVDDRGRPTGTSISIPPAVGGQTYSYQPDATGHVLVSAVGGVYDARPDGLRLVTHGVVLAAGPSTFLVYECGQTASCGTVVVNRQTGRRRKLAGVSIRNPRLSAGGRIAPDGRTAAIIEYTGGTPASGPITPVLRVIDLRSGADQTIDLHLSDENTSPPQVLAFSPDGRYLLVVTASGRIAAVAIGSGALIRLAQPIPPVRVLSIVPTG